MNIPVTLLDFILSRRRLNAEGIVELGLLDHCAGLRALARRTLIGRYSWASVGDDVPSDASVMYVKRMSVVGCAG